MPWAIMKGESFKNGRTQSEMLCNKQRDPPSRHMATVPRRSSRICRAFALSRPRFRPQSA
eukprot:scaffold103128_cov31-Tisochrysis_lutea.AAC.5